MLGRENVDRALTANPTKITDRERAFRVLVDASHEHDAQVREAAVGRAAKVLTVDEVYQANMVIALFSFYNKWIDLNGVNPLSPEGYAASGKRLAQNGYIGAPAPK